MHPWLFLVITLLLLGCAARSDHVYKFKEPVTGLSGQPVTIAAADWAACDRKADREGQLAYKTPPSQQKRTALGGAFGLIGGIIVAATSSDPAEEERVTAREAAYEEVLRMCLRGKRYPVQGRDEPGFAPVRP